MRSLALAAVTSIALGIFGFTDVDAQMRWGRPQVPRSGACFYRDADFRGDYFCARAGENIGVLPQGMNDEVSSIRIFGNVEVTIFRDGRFRGQSARFRNDVQNLGFQGWNDAMSSVTVRVASGRGGDGGRPPVWGGGQPMPREGACFYTDANFRGQSFCVARGGSYASLPNGFNDRISSIRVQRATVVIFSDGRFGGHTERVTADIPNLGGRWNDRISSLRVF